MCWSVLFKSYLHSIPLLVLMSYRIYTVMKVKRTNNFGLKYFVMSIERQDISPQSFNIVLFRILFIFIV